MRDIRIYITFNLREVCTKKERRYDRRNCVYIYGPRQQEKFQIYFLYPFLPALSSHYCQILFILRSYTKVLHITLQYFALFSSIMHKLVYA